MYVSRENSCIVATEQCITSRNLLFPGNIIPHFWYKSFAVKGSTDLVAITILADIVAWWRNSDKIISSKDFKSPNFNGESLLISYEYLFEKFGFNKETARRAFVRLEKAQTLTRQVKNVKSESGSYINRLYIVLNQKFYHSCFRSSDLDIRVRDSKQEDQVNNEAAPQAEAYINSDKLQSPQISGDHICNNTKGFNTRSDESNFVENNLEEKKEINTLLAPNVSISVIKSVVDKVKAKFTGNKRKSIAELAPITEDEADNLRASSKREFSLHYINKLKVKLGDKYPQHGFYSRAKFLEYLSKTLANELRQESTVNNESFQFKKDADTSRIDNYLRAIEDSKDTDCITQLKKKIVAVFESEISYKILTACKFKEKICKTNIFEIQQLRNLTISECETNRLLKEVRAVFGDKITELSFKYHQVQRLASESADDDRPQLNLGKEGTIWRKASIKLLEIFGENIHRSWFSKLEAIEDKGQDYLTLKAPTEFIKQYIQSNYLSEITAIKDLCGQTMSKLRIEII